jgi:uncharacterized membrane protein YfhO
LQAPGELFVPVAYIEGTQLLLDGKPTEIDSYERLVAFKAPAGDHSVEIRLRPTSVYVLGWTATAVSILALLLLLIFELRSKR